MLLIYNRPGFLEEMSEQERTGLFGEVDAIVAELVHNWASPAGAVAFPLVT